MPHEGSTTLLFFYNLKILALNLQEQVLRMRYGMDGEDPMSLTGIGRILGMSRDRVRNLERDGLAGLRRISDQVEAYVAC